MDSRTTDGRIKLMVGSTDGGLGVWIPEQRMNLQLADGGDSMIGGLGEWQTLPDRVFTV